MKFRGTFLGSSTSDHWVNPAFVQTVYKQSYGPDSAVLLVIDGCTSPLFVFDSTLEQVVQRLMGVEHG